MPTFFFFRRRNRMPFNYLCVKIIYQASAIWGLIESKQAILLSYLFENCCQNKLIQVTAHKHSTQLTGTNAIVHRKLCMHIH